MTLASPPLDIAREVSVNRTNIKKLGGISPNLNGESTKMERTMFTPVLGELQHVKSENGFILTEPFLNACKHLLPVIDKFGPAMALVKADVGANVSRLQFQYSDAPAPFEFLHCLVQREIENKTTKSLSSCTTALLRLTRIMDFLVALFQSLIEHDDWTLSQACTESYNKTLKKRHNWLASSIIIAVMKLVSDRKKFMEVIGGTGNINADMEKFCTRFSPLLKENHKFLALFGLDA